MLKRIVIFAFLMLWFFAVIGVGGCGLFGGDQSSPEKATEAFMEALKNQDSEKLAELTGEDPGEMIFDVDEKIHSYDIEKVDTLGDFNAVAKVIFKFREDNDPEEELFDVRYTLELIKSGDDKWYIADLDFEFDWSILDIKRTQDEPDIDADADPDLEEPDFDWDQFDDIDMEDLFPENDLELETEEDDLELETEEEETQQ